MSILKRNKQILVSLYDKQNVKIESLKVVTEKLESKTQFVKVNISKVILIVFF